MIDFVTCLAMDVTTWLVALGAAALVLNLVVALGSKRPKPHMAVSEHAKAAFTRNTPPMAAFYPWPRNPWLLQRTVVVSWLIGAGVLYAAAAIFGAPPRKGITAIWAAAQSAVTAVPIGLWAPTSSMMELHSFLMFPFEWLRCHPLVVAGLASLLGAWLGSVVVPLDWGVWWQVWPISHSFAAVGGWLLGAAVGAAARLCDSRAAAPPRAHVE